MLDSPSFEYPRRHHSKSSQTYPANGGELSHKGVQESFARKVAGLCLTYLEASKLCLRLVLGSCATVAGATQDIMVWLHGDLR